jgi:hypothetical protein
MWQSAAGSAAAQAEALAYLLLLSERGEASMVCDKLGSVAWDDDHDISCKLDMMLAVPAAAL